MRHQVFVGKAELGEGLRFDHRFAVDTHHGRSNGRRLCIGHKHRVVAEACLAGLESRDCAFKLTIKEVLLALRIKYDHLTEEARIAVGQLLKTHDFQKL